MVPKYNFGMMFGVDPIKVLYPGLYSLVVKKNALFVLVWSY